MAVTPYTSFTRSCLYLLLRLLRSYWPELCTQVSHGLVCICCYGCYEVTGRNSVGYPMLRCHAVTLLRCYDVTMLRCYDVTMLRCTLSRCDDVTLLRCYAVTMLRCNDVTLLAHLLVHQDKTTRYIEGAYFILNLWSTNHVPLRVLIIKK